MRRFIVVLTLFLAPIQAGAQTVAGWEMRTPDGAAAPCRAVKPQGSFNVQLLRNYDDQIVVSVGGADMSQRPGARVGVALSIDGGDPVPLEGTVIGPVTFFRVTDEMLAQSLRGAHTTVWRFPWGELSADVAGLGEAFDAITVCPS